MMSMFMGRSQEAVLSYFPKRSRIASDEVYSFIFTQILF